MLRRWVLGSLAIAGLLLLAVWAIAGLSSPGTSPDLNQPPLAAGDLGDAAAIFGHNLLVLALHAMACVAGFIAGSSLPLQAEHRTGLSRTVHERGRTFAMGFVLCATAFSLGSQAYALGTATASVANVLHTAPGLLLLGLLPHALPELVALFLPLAAWIGASRRGEWDTLLAATLVTVVVAIPVLALAALWEVYGAPHLLATMFASSLGSRSVIERYTRPELAEIWSDRARFEAMRQVEVAACEEMGGPEAAELEAIRAATFTVEAIAERERVTDHDVAAFVDVLAADAGSPGRWIHHGLTSSDVLDTGLALQLRRAGEMVLPDARRLVSALAARAREEVGTLCVGRTHGIHAEPTTFGIKLAGFAFEAARNADRLERAFAQVAVGALSGAVGTYAATSPDFEQRVLARLGLAAEPVSTQVVPRDRHAELLQAIALAGAGLERFATELRHLARTEVAEAREPFAAGQKGSSAMPHKRNPIKSEQVSGLARILRANAQAAVEDVALWHERDISHSSVERVILPDSTILLDHMQRRVIALVEGMVIDPERMRSNLELTCGALFSQRVLLALVATGMSRDDAYRTVQRLAQQALDERTPLRELLGADPVSAALDLDAIFDYGPFVRFAPEIVGRLDQIA